MLARRIRTLPHRFQDFVTRLRGYVSPQTTAFGIGIDWTKRSLIKRLFPQECWAFLPYGPHYNETKIIKTSAVSRFYVWGMRDAHLSLSAIPEAKIIRIEDGFLHSKNLGATGARAHSWTIDSRTFHFDARIASDLERALNAKPECNKDFVAGIIERLKIGRVSKYTLPHSQDITLPNASVLVIGQVEDDASIRACPEGIQTNAALLAHALDIFGHDRVWFKPHPDVAHGLRPSRSDPNALIAPERIIATGCTLPSLLCQKPIIVTISSLSGFEALWYDCEVYTHGSPFYAGWGLTHDAIAFPRRAARLSLEQIFQVAYIDYPLYFDPNTGKRCGIEDVIALLENKATG